MVSLTINKSTKEEMAHNHPNASDAFLVFKSYIEDWFGSRQV